MKIVKKKKNKDTVVKPAILDEYYELTKSALLEMNIIPVKQRVYEAWGNLNAELDSIILDKIDIMTPSDISLRRHIKAGYKKKLKEKLSKYYTTAVVNRGIIDTSGFVGKR